MRHASAFSPDYATARQRLAEAATAAGFTHRALPYGADGPDGPLSIDALWRGPAAATRALVISSGLHGVEGYLGAAIQLALVEPLARQALPADTGVLLLHALNPYGMAWSRRVDVDNIDLNRNFLLQGEPFSGAPARYPALDPFFNPTTPPRARWSFYPRAAALIARHGMAALKDTLPVGQYEFPKGLFYGGSGPSRTWRLLDEALPSWLGAARRVLHVDFHSGIGRWGTYKLFPNTREPARVAALERAFGAEVVEGWDPSKTSYAIRGGLGEWLDARFPEARYDLVTAEFGTWHVLRIVEALRNENRATHHAPAGSPALTAARHHLRKAFCPSDPAWRDACVEQGLGIARQAAAALLETA